MRALVGGVIGATASTAAWLALEHYQQSNYGWLALLVGLVTGICVHRAGAKGAGAGVAGGTARGALAIILTLAAIVGGQEVYAKIMQATSTSAAAVTMESIQTKGADEGESAAADTGPSAADIPILDEEAVGLGQPGYSKTAMTKNLSDSDMIWMCAAALAAYVTGKGGGTNKRGTVTEEISDVQQPEPESESEPDPKNQEA